MAWKNKSAISYTINKDENAINEVIEENGNMITMLREVNWGKGFKLELRKWIVDTNNEQPMKGCAMTDTGWNTCAETLVKHGYGSTKEILSYLKNREDFEKSLIATIGKKKVVESKESVVEVDDYFMPTKENLGL